MIGSQLALHVSHPSKVQLTLVAHPTFGKGSARAPAQVKGGGGYSRMKGGGWIEERKNWVLEAAAAMRAGGQSALAGRVQSPSLHQQGALLPDGEPSSNTLECPMLCSVHTVCAQCNVKICVQCEAFNVNFKMCSILVRATV